MINKKYLLVVLITIFSCSRIVDLQEEPKSEETSIMQVRKIMKKGDSIYPLSIGNYWIYNNYLVKNGIYKLVMIEKLIVEDSLKINYNNKNYNVFKIQKTSSFIDTLTQKIRETSTIYDYLNNENGVINYFNYDEERKINYSIRTVIKYPIQVGDSWFWDYGDYGDTYKCVSINDTVTLYNTKYECITKQMNGGINGAKYYYSKGIGLVMAGPEKDVSEYKTYGIILLMENEIK